MKSLRTFLSWAFVAAIAFAMGSLSVSLMSPPARAASYFTQNLSGLSFDSSQNFAFAKPGTISVGATTTGVTDLLINPATKASGNLIDAQVNGTSGFKVDYAGAGTFSGAVTTSGAINAGSGSISGGGSLLVTNGSGSGVRWYPTNTNGQMQIVDQNVSTGVTLDVGTANTLTVKTKTGSAAGAITAGAGTFSGLVSVGGSTPASAAATGTAGTITWDASYIYVCTATNTWKRVAIATW